MKNTGLSLLDGIEVGAGLTLWSGELLRRHYPEEKHPDTDLVLVTTDGKSIGFDDISDLAELLELELDQSWDSEATSLQVGQYRIVQTNSEFKVAKVDLSDVAELWGDVEDYYPDEGEEIDYAWERARRDAWERSRQKWTEAVQALDFARASSVESVEHEWGDDPATRRILQEINLEEEL